MAKKSKKEDSLPQSETKEKLSRKQRRAQAKERARKQRELEKQLIAEGKISPRIKYERRSFLWNALAVSLAFVLGICATVGGLAGAGYLALTKVSTKDVISALGKNYEEYVSPDYAEKTLLDLGLDVYQTIADGITNLDELGKYTPLLEKQIEKVRDIAAETGIVLDVDEMMATEFSSLGSYIQNAIQTAELGAVLKVTPSSDALMLAICYGKEGEDYTVTEDNKIVMNEGKTATTVSSFTADPTSVIDKIEIATLMDVDADSSPAMRYLAFGTQDIDYEIVTDADTQKKTINMINGSQPKHISDLEDDSLIDNAKIGDLMEIVTDEEAKADPSKKASSSLMQAIRDWKVSDLKQQSRIERLKICQVMTVDENSSSLMKAIGDWRIGDMAKQEKINSLVLGDVLTIDESSPKLLQSLKNTAIGKFDSAITELRLEEMMDDLEENKILKFLKDSTVDTISSDVEALTFQQVFAEEVYGYYDPASVNKDGIDRTEDDKPQNVLAHHQVTGFKTANGYEVKEGYFTEPMDPDDPTKGTPVEDKTIAYSAIIQKENRDAQAAYDEAVAAGETPELPVWNTPYYYKENIEVIRDFTFGVVDYGNGGAIVPLTAEIKQETVEGEVLSYYEKTVTVQTEESEPTTETVKMYLKQDASGDYAQSENKLYRDDLERIYSYYLSQEDYENGTAVPERPADPEEDTVYTDDIFASDGKFYYEVRVPVYECEYYIDGSSTVTRVTDDQIKEVYYEILDEETNELGTTELSRELKGTWYLLLTDKDGNELFFSLLDMEQLTSHMKENVNASTLYDLWFHDILQAHMPDVDISDLNFTVNGETVNNINELTIYQTIELVEKLVDTNKNIIIE